MSIVLLGSTSGSCTLQEQAVAGTSVLTLPVGTGTVVANNVNSAIVSGTAVASTSGTSIDFTGIPSWVKRITVIFSGVSTNGTSDYLIQLGDSGGVETTGYISSSSNQVGAVVNSTDGYIITVGSATAVVSGIAVITSIANNIWVNSSTLKLTATSMAYNAGDKTLSDTLDRIRITTVNGTDTFDAGSINILFE